MQAPDPLPTRALSRLARAHGIAPVYIGSDFVVRGANRDALLAMLRALGVGIDDPAEAPELLRARWRDVWSRPLEPVHVVWTDAPAGLRVRLPAGAETAPLRATVELEGGGSASVEARCTELPRRALRSVDGAARVALHVPLPELPPGYHRVHVAVAGVEADALLIAAPRRCHPVGSGRTAAFLPVYALHSARRPDCADLTDWTRFGRFVAEQGVDLVGTLPLCAGFLEPPVQPSPYAPASRLFWNEVYVDVDRLDGGGPHAPAPRAPADARFVDWPTVAADRLAALQTAADRHFAEHGPDGSAALRAFVARRPDVADFAIFRAAAETHGRDWRQWPARWRDGTIEPAEVAPAARRRHLFAQWQTQEQIDASLAEMRAAGAEPYLDLPIGAHSDGYDIWRYRDAFLTGCSAGAPPDAFFTQGQDWGFAPRHPERSRATGHLDFRRCIEHHVRHCGVLRIDHVMGLHRIWSVPHGLPAHLGCYLRQPGEELLAIVTLESHRHRCAIIGEDLGTVPPATRLALPRHGVGSMHVVQFELRPWDAHTALTPGPRMLATLNTHDLPTFRAFLEALDVEDRVALGLFDEATADRERWQRGEVVAALRDWLARHGELADPGGADAAACLQGVLRALAQSDAAVVVVGIEDLWLEPQPQNVPGTTEQRPNWKRRAQWSLDRIIAEPQLAATLHDVVARRHGRPAPGRT
ncbi:MAG: 4-alpha-glucanotransferase [Planctomycetes bacterium]|nr:4-alpha-glucanotransferase [Planctomycetota bacterium]